MTEKGKVLNALSKSGRDSGLPSLLACGEEDELGPGYIGGLKVTRND